MGTGAYFKAEVHQAQKGLSPSTILFYSTPLICLYGTNVDSLTFLFLGGGEYSSFFQCAAARAMEEARGNMGFRLNLDTETGRNILFPRN